MTAMSAFLDGIISYLPTRQTLLFSATQTKSVKDLARLSLNNPEYIAVHAAEESTTPSQLLQHYVVVPLQEKMDTLYSFIKMHLHSKMIVFFSTCSQVPSLSSSSHAVLLEMCHHYSPGPLRVRPLLRDAAGHPAHFFAWEDQARAPDDYLQGLLEKEECLLACHRHRSQRLGLPRCWLGGADGRPGGLRNVQTIPHRIVVIILFVTSLPQVHSSGGSHCQIQCGRQGAVVAGAKWGATCLGGVESSRSAD